ncbi:MAG: hypothetical protein AAF804_06685 [Bacteroidota bacterium]
MRISGFSFGKNAVKLYFPFKEAVASILPLVDEFVVALGDSDEDDRSREALESLRSPKLKLIDTVWDLAAYPRGMENAHQTDVAKSHCRGDWLFYLQADEVIHEKYLPVIRARCEELLHAEAVEGLLFGYQHFWGDYQHVHRSHGWYRHEIRIIRNRPDIHSWESAQSFRVIPNFDGKSYRQQAGTRKLRVAKVDAEVYHYGWVRPPKLMQAKSQALDTIHKGAAAAQELHADRPLAFDYGDLSRIPTFEGTHPEVMKDFIARFDWADQLRFTGGNPDNRPLYKHEQLKYRVVSWLENHLPGRPELGSFRNYELVR